MKFPRWRIRCRADQWQQILEELRMATQALIDLQTEAAATIAEIQNAIAKINAMPGSDDAALEDLRNQLATARAALAAAAPAA